MTSGNLNS